MRYVQMSLDNLKKAYKALCPESNKEFADVKAAAAEVLKAHRELLAKKTKTEVQKNLLEKLKPYLDAEDEFEKSGAKDEPKAKAKAESKPKKSLAELAAEQGQLSDEEMAENGLKKDNDGKVVKTEKTKAEKVYKTKDEIREAIANGVSKSWDDVNIAVARKTHNGVTVDGQVYGSVNKAFIELGLNPAYHISFRKIVKICKNVVLKEGDKEYKFVLMDGNGQTKDASKAEPTIVNGLSSAPKIARGLQIKQHTPEEIQEMEDAAKKVAEEKAKAKVEKAKAAAEKAKAKAEAKAEAKPKVEKPADPKAE